ncbi:hypothetical protein B0H17DRAFT_1335529 [Mycena rosella]|uniref:Uncharacterized protein n=1 Tax=Mycena rosella TaxID=1033263 RepID=A0AAD7CZ15_MYCRO|nr:hypothetical protein B0H17DRAFT_1335529 [Mycena rosella]
MLQADGASKGACVTPDPPPRDSSEFSCVRGFRLLCAYMRAPSETRAHRRRRARIRDEEVLPLVRIHNFAQVTPWHSLGLLSSSAGAPHPYSLHSKGRRRAGSLRLACAQVERARCVLSREGAQLGDGLGAERIRCSRGEQRAPSRRYNARSRASSLLAAPDSNTPHLCPLLHAKPRVQLGAISPSPRRWAPASARTAVCVAPGPMDPDKYRPRRRCSGVQYIGHRVRPRPHNSMYAPLAPETSDQRRLGNPSRMRQLSYTRVRLAAGVIKKATKPALRDTCECASCPRTWPPEVSAINATDASKRKRTNARSACRAQGPPHLREWSCGRGLRLVCTRSRTLLHLSPAAAARYSAPVRMPVHAARCNADARMDLGTPCWNMKPQSITNGTRAECSSIFSPGPAD